MLIRFRQFLPNLALELSKDISASLSLCLTLQILSEIQVVSITLSPLLFSLASKGNGPLFDSIRDIMSNLKTSVTWSENKDILVIKLLLGVTILYLSAQVIALIYLIYQISKQHSKDKMSTTVTFFLFLHSRVIFYLVHCFLMSTMSLNISCYNSNISTSFYCGTPWLVVICLSSFLNLSLAFAKEVCFYHMIRFKNCLSTKDNAYSIITLIQKTLVVFFMYHVTSTNFQVLISSLNLVFNFIRPYLLHTRLSFYNLIVLKASLALASGSMGLSPFCLVFQLYTNNNLVVMMLIMLPLTVKLSLIKLNYTFKKIFNLEAKTVYEITHLPILFKNYLTNSSSYSESKNVDKNMFVLTQLLKEKVADIFNLADSKSIDKTKAYGFTIIQENLLRILKKKPKNVLLCLSVAQIYIKYFKDIPNAISMIGKLKALNLTIPEKNSFNYIYAQLQTKYLKTTQTERGKHYYVHYFSEQEKIVDFKKRLEKEIREHLLYWKILSKDVVDVKELAKRAKSVAVQSDCIEKYWQTIYLKDFQRQHINIYILYGIYVNTVQGLSHLGNSIVEKGYRMLRHNKELAESKLMDILSGKGAIVTVSLEAGKLGEVINASASVDKLFEIDKKKLIGSNIDVIMPKMIARKHKNFIEKFKKDFRYDFTRQMNTLGKTLNDKYFGVEINMRLLPAIEHGINLIGSIKKKTNNISTIITNFDGRIIEYSADMKNFIGGYQDLSKLCPEFFEINQAFNIVYQTNAEENLRLVSDSQKNPLQKSSSKNFDTNLIPSETTLTNKKHLISREDTEIRKNLLKSEQNSFYTDLEDNLSHLKPRKNAMQNLMQIDQAKIVYEKIIKKGKKLKFCGPNCKNLEFKTRIEPYVLDGEVYKILKLKHIKTSNKLISQNNEFEILEIEDYSVPDERNKPAKILMTIKEPLALSCEVKLSKNPTSLPNSSDDSIQDNFEEVEKSQFQKSKLSAQKSKVGSVIGSEKSQINQGKGILAMLRQKHNSQTIKTSIFIAFVVLTAVVVLVALDYNLKTKSLNNMKDAMGLIDIVRKRLIKTTSAWLSMLTVYARSSGFRPMTSFIKGLQTTARDSSIEMLANSNLLKRKVNDFNDVSVVELFFEKKISLWEPYQNKTYFMTKVDSFIATQIIADYGIFLGNYPGSLLELNQRREVLFALNNTANDFLISVERAISQVEKFSINSNHNNANLLIALLSCKLVALIIPFMLIILLFRSLIMSYKRLLQALFTIQNFDIKKRVGYLQNLNNFLEKNVEETLASCNLTNHLSAKTHNDTSNPVTFHGSKEYKFANLYMYFGKYFIFLLIVAVPAIGIFSFTFSSAYEGLSNLDSIMNQMLVASRLGTLIALINPNFYFSAIFLNQTSFKVRNTVPTEQLLFHLTFLETANNVLTSSLSTPGKGIDDPFVESFLKTNVCDYMIGSYITFCLDVTNRNSFGLLGLNSKYLNLAGQSLKDYSNKPTVARAQQIWTDLSSVFGTLAPVVNKVYEKLTDYLIAKYLESVDNEISNSLRYLILNMIAIFLSSILIRITIFNRLKQLDKGVKQILRVLPLQIIEENKFIKHYLSREFSKELKKNYQGF